jgi:uncharacterized phage-associated protein
MRSRKLRPQTEIKLQKYLYFINIKSKNVHENNLINASIASASNGAFYIWVYI